MKEKWHGRGPWSGVFGPWNGNGKWGTGGTGAPHPYMRLPLKSDSRSKGPLRLGESTSVSRTEDFTTYTEVDGGADTAYTTTADSVQFTVPRDETSYIYKDFGTDYFSGDFEHRVKVNINGGGIAYVWGLANSLNDFKTIIDASEDYLAVMFNSGNQLAGIFESDGGSSESDTFTYADSTDYYLKIKRDESVGTYGTLYCYVYSDAAYSVLVDTLSIELSEKEDFRYIYVLSSHNNSNATELSGTISNLQLDTANYFDGNLVVKANGGEARFEPDGYLDEPESTNLLTYSRNFATATTDWGTTSVPSPFTQNQVGIDGVANSAWLLGAANGAGYDNLYNQISKVATDVSAYTFSVYVGKASSATYYTGIELRFLGGTADPAQYTIDHVNGAVIQRGGTTAADSTQVESVGDFWRVSITFHDPNADNDIVRGALYTAVNTDASGTWVASTTGSGIVFDFAQLENASVPTSPIYTTSTAVTRPADSFSLTMSDEFKAHFAEALGSELAPDFGVVLGPELITAQNDRDFNTDEGNWTVFTDGTSTVAHNTDSIGGHDDTQIKVSSAAGDDYALARIQSPTHTETIDQDSYYFFSADVYLDPNSDQDTISIYPSNFSTSNYVINSSGLAGKDVTPNKGVWERVWNIFELADDVAGNYFIGFFDIGNLTTNDIVYVDNVSLRKITFSDDWTAGTGWGPKFALTAPSLGDEELSNGDFSSVTEGSDLFDSGVGDYRDNTGNWSAYGTNTVANDSDALLITWVDNASGASLVFRDANDLSANLEVGHQYEVIFSAKVEAGKSVSVDVRRNPGGMYSTLTVTETSFTEKKLRFIAASTTSDFIMACDMDASNDKIWVRDFTIKEITLDGHDTPTVDADDYLEYDTDNDRVRVVATDDSANLIQSGILTVGSLYYYEIDVQTVTSGGIKLYCYASEAYDKPMAQTGAPIVITTAGVHSGVFRAGSTTVSIQRYAYPSDVTINSWSIKPYTPAHSNTDPRFDRQTESNEYTSDFSADADGWTAYDGAVAGNIDGIDGEDDTLRFTVSTGLAGKNAKRNFSYSENERIKVTFDYYIPSGQSNIDGIQLYDLSNAEFLGDTHSTTDAWTTITVYFTAGSGTKTLRVYPADGGETNFQDAGGDDVFYIKNVTVDAVTLSDYTGNNWYPYDEDGGAIHVAGNSSAIYQDIGVADSYYLFIYKLSNVTAGGIVAYCGNGSVGTIRTTDGVYSEILPIGNNTLLGMAPGSGFAGTIDYCYIIPITTPVAHCTGSQSAASNLVSTEILSTGADYKATTVMANRSAGWTYVYLGNTNTGLIQTADGTKTYYDSSLANNKIYLQANADFVGDITALSVKQVTRHAQGTVLVAWTPGWSYADYDAGTSLANNQILDIGADVNLCYVNRAANTFGTYDGSTPAKTDNISYASGTTYFVAIKFGEVSSNINYYGIGAIDISFPWTSSDWGTLKEFDGAYTLGTDLGLFSTKFGSNNLRDLMFFDRILTDKEIEHFRKQIN
jgi:hypothetical protein